MGVVSQCPFLTTAQEKVQCFDECAFYNWGDSSGICPFKNLNSTKSYSTKNMFNYHVYDENPNAFYDVAADEEYI